MDTENQVVGCQRGRGFRVGEMDDGGEAALWGWMVTGLVVGVTVYRYQIIILYACNLH